jgi:hypothetical protein
MTAISSSSLERESASPLATTATIASGPVAETSDASEPTKPRSRSSSGVRFSSERGSP